MHDTVPHVPPKLRVRRISRRHLVVQALLVATGASAVATAAGACGSTTSQSSPTAAAGSAATSTASTGSMAASPMAQISQTQTVGPFKLTLMVGPQEEMYTQEQANQQHPMSGEVMVGGTMAMPGGTPMTGMSMPATDSNTYHLELHVADATTGKTIADAKVAMELIDNSANDMATNVPIATMYGVTAGMDDFHYGNNVVMPPNHDYSVNVAVNGTDATFKFHLGT